MVTIVVKGGIGNQLFQYSLFLFCVNHGTEAVLDNSVYKSVQMHGGYQIEKMLPNSISTIRYSSREYWKPTYIERVVRKAASIAGIRNSIGNRYYDESFNSYRDLIAISANSNIIADGYWQKYELVHSVLPIIKSQKASIKDVGYTRQIMMSVKMNSCESVSIHVRRGDYLKNDINRKLYGDICTSDYYFSAILELKKTLNNPLFFVFSDDVGYCKDLFKGPEYVFIDPTEPEMAFTDILLMGECKHHILANSTFSWWGAMLSERDGIIIMPQKFDNDEKINPRIIPGSIVLNNKGKMITEQ